MHKLIITCEHGGNEVPQAYVDLFKPHQLLLNSHRGYDPGALELAQNLAKHFHVELDYSTITRLLIELNRSMGHPSLFSKLTKSLPKNRQQQLIEKYYLPYRQKIIQKINASLAQGKSICHLSIHSFTPILDGVPRHTDIGLLYDPKRLKERHFCQHWKNILKHLNPNYTVKMNYPYRGNSDGLTTHLRSLYTEDEYLGIELEVNQQFPLENGKEWIQFKNAITCSLDRLFVKDDLLGKISNF